MAFPIDAETLTDAQGRYEFPHLSVGARTFFYSAAGRNLAPGVRDVIVVQDGLGAVLDVALEKSRTLTVRIGPALKRPATLRLIPRRWIPEWPAASVGPADSTTVFAGLGRPYHQGLIAASGVDPGSPWVCVGRYDLDAAGEVFLSGGPFVATRGDLPEAAAIAAPTAADSAVEASFYAALSPIALFWPRRRDDEFGPPVRLRGPSAAKTVPATGAARGFGPLAFAPVLIQPRSGGSRIEWTSDASEFACAGLPPGPCLVRGLDVHGRLSFARGLYVAAGSETTLAPAFWTKIDLDEPESREVSGFVRWENGAPAVKAEVFVQNAGDFRRYLRRVETDEGGFFRAGGLLGGETYFVFALPPGDATAMRRFAYFSVFPSQREISRDATLHPHRIAGDLGGLDPGAAARIVAIEPKAERVLWTTRPDAAGRFVVANIPHGRYRVDAVSSDQKILARSEVLEIGDGRSEAGVRWLSK